MGTSTSTDTSIQSNVPIFLRPEMLDFIKDQDQEYVILAQGIPSEIVNVKKFTIKDYLLQVEYLKSK